jgi:hypothetical protein
MVRSLKLNQRLLKTRKISKSLRKHRKVLSRKIKLLPNNLVKKRLNSRIREVPMNFSSKKRRRNKKISKLSMRTN